MLSEIRRAANSKFQLRHMHLTEISLGQGIMTVFWDTGLNGFLEQLIQNPQEKDVILDLAQMRRGHSLRGELEEVLCSNKHKTI